jgi:hypothetical protein
MGRGLEGTSEAKTAKQWGLSVGSFLGYTLRVTACSFPRPKPGESLVVSTLLQCKRRCCLCWYLKHDLTAKKGQIAHADHDRNNNAEPNLVYLCLSHHDWYDSHPSVTRSMTARELGHAQQLLYDALADLYARAGPIPKILEALLTSAQDATKKTSDLLM